MTSKELQLAAYVVECAAVTLGNVFEDGSDELPNDTILGTFTEAERVELAVAYHTWDGSEQDGLPMDFHAYSLATFLRFVSWRLTHQR